MSNYKPLQDPAENYGGYKDTLVPDTTEKKPARCCGCRRKECLIAFVVVAMMVCGGFALYLYSRGGKYNDLLVHSLSKHL